MTERDAKTLSLRGQIQLKYVKRAPKPVAVFQCLIVSADAARREMLERAASAGGWKTFPCADATAALTFVSRSFVQLAVVDLEHQPSELFRPLVQRLSSSNGLLLVVCGNEGQTDEEVWVRQHGAWLYLPVVDGGNFTVLCSEALHIAERLQKPDSLNRQPAPLANQVRSYS